MLYIIPKKSNLSYHTFCACCGGFTASTHSWCTEYSTFSILWTAVVRLVAMAKSFAPFPRRMNSNKLYVLSLFGAFVFIRMMPFMEECWALKMWCIILLFHSFSPSRYLLAPLFCSGFPFVFPFKAFAVVFFTAKIPQDYMGTSKQTSKQSLGDAMRSCLY